MVCVSPSRGAAGTHQIVEYECHNNGQSHLVNSCPLFPAARMLTPTRAHRLDASVTTAEAVAAGRDSWMIFETGATGQERNA